MKIRHTKKYFIFGLSLCFVLGINLYFRTFPINFPQLKKEAKKNIENKIYLDAIRQINDKFPQYNSLAKDTLTKVLAGEIQKRDNSRIKQQIREEYQRLKSKYQDNNGQTYLLELDCWHWARYVENVISFGHAGDAIKNRREWDTLMFAPQGSPLIWSQFLFYLSAFLYKLFCFFKIVPLFSFLFYLPLFFSAIFLIILYLFALQCSKSNLGALFASLVIGLNSVLLYRSCAGWFDMDVLNLILPLLIVFFYLKSYDFAVSRLWFFLVFISAFLVGLFSFTWIYWWFIFITIIISQIYLIVNLACVNYPAKGKKTGLYKQYLFSLGLFISLSIIWVFIFSGVTPLKAISSHLRNAVTLNNTLRSLSIWPNVYTTVEELQKTDITQIIHYCGGLFIFVSSVLSILVIFILDKYKKYSVFQRQAIIVFVFWFFAMFFACFKGSRFIIFLIIPTGICFGWLISEIYRYFVDKKKKKLVYFLLIIVIILSCKFMYDASRLMVKVFPYMDDNWNKLLVKIKNNTSPQAVINSWWDFGDWYKTVAKRKVIFDGHSQNTPQAYWMARVLISKSEKEAINILRMLNNGGNQAFEIINSYLNDPLRSIFLIDKIISSDERSIGEILLKNLPSFKVDEVKKLLFDKPPKAYFIVDYTMLKKIRHVSFLGNWDFTKAYLVKNIHKKTKQQNFEKLKKIGLDKQKVERLYEEVVLVDAQNVDEWVSQRSSFYGSLVKSRQEGNSVFFDNGLVYYPVEEKVYFHACKNNGYRLPRSLFVFRENQISEIAYDKADLDFSVLIFNPANGYESIFLDPELANSLFVRLYFFNAQGLKYFKPVIEEKDGNDYIRVFEIIWD